MRRGGADPDLYCMNVTHLFGSFRGLGGVQNLLRHHHAEDAQFGLNSRFVIYHEPEEPPVERVRFLNVEDRTRLQTLRQRFAAAARVARTDVAVYHGLWGMGLFSDLDHAHRRVLVVHGKFEGLERLLRARDGMLDGVVTVSEETAQLVARTLPAMALERIIRLPLPITRCPVVLPPRSPLLGRPLRLGYCGRLIEEHKRVSRLPELVRALRAAGVDFELELLGDGPARTELLAALADGTPVRWHGTLAGADYWRALAAWDVIAFCSDTEGMPIALLEALSVGVLPVYPRIGSGGDNYVAGVWPELLYPPRDMLAAARAIQHLQRLAEPELNALRLRASQAVEGNRSEDYFPKLNAALRRMSEQPRRSHGRGGLLVHVLGGCSMKTLARLAAWRRRW